MAETKPTEASRPPETLIEKLAAVMAAVERVPKNGENKFHGYKYATEADLSDAVRASLARYGVMLIPSVEKVEWTKVPTQKGEERLATLTVKFTATDGKTDLSFVVIGEGQDRGDKATYKAMTGATKYALLKLFLIPTGDDPERDENDPPPKRAPAKPAPAKPAAATDARAAAAQQAASVRASAADPKTRKAAALKWLADRYGEVKYRSELARILGRTFPIDVEVTFQNLHELETVEQWIALAKAANNGEARA
jgi:hypothetical protein